MARQNCSCAAILGMTVIFVLSVAAFPNCGSAQQSASARPRQPADLLAYRVVDLYERSKAEERILAALDDPTEIEFTNTPLYEGLAYLAELHNIVIVLDEPALAAEGINRDEPVTRILKDLTLRNALNLMLEPLGLTYVVANDVLMITTETAASRRMETHVYHISVLTDAGLTSDEVARTIQATIGPSSWSNCELHAPRSKSDRSTVGLPGKTGSPDKAHRSSSAPSATSTLAGLPGGFPGSFKKASPKQEPAPTKTDDDSSSPRAAIVPLTDAVVVTHSPLVHREVLSLLRQLERLTGQKVP